MSASSPASPPTAATATVPWSFLLGLPVGFCLCIAVFIGFLYSEAGVPTHQSQWIYDLLSKKEKLAAAIPGPRLLIVAGSSTLFSINAKLIEEQTGLPTLNFGAHAGISIQYRLYRMKKVVRPGDTVLLACEYEYYTDSQETHGEWNDDYVLARDPEYFYQLPLSVKIAIATRIEFKRLQKGWENRWTKAKPQRPPGPPPYSAYSLTAPGIDCTDDRGDEVYNHADNIPPMKPIAYDRLLPVLINGLASDHNADFDAIASFIEWAHAHQVTVLATFPNLIRQPEYSLPPARRTIKTITRFYQSHNVPVIGTADEVMLPRDQFYDTMYHLTYEAGLARTERLIPELRPYLPVKK